MKADTQVRRIVADAAVDEGSVHRLARLAGVSQSSLNSWLRGTTGISWTVLSKVLDYIGVNVTLR